MHKCIIHFRVIPQTIRKKVVSMNVWYSVHLFVFAFFIYTEHM